MDSQEKDFHTLLPCPYLFRLSYQLLATSPVVFDDRKNIARRPKKLFSFNFPLKSAAVLVFRVVMSQSDFLHFRIVA